MAIPPYDLQIGTYTEDDHLIAATQEDREPRMRIYCLPRPVVVLGRGSKPEVELNQDACRADRIPLLRRRGGGCAVLVDPGNVIVAVVLPVQGIGGNLRYFDQISRWLAAALTCLGIEGVRREGSSDLVLGDRKVGGACIYRTKDLLYYSATLLVNPQLELMERYLRHPPREPAYRQGRNHSQFIQPLCHLSDLTEADRGADQLRPELHLSMLISSIAL